MVCLRESLPAHLSPHPNLIITDIAYSPQRSLLQLCTCILLINFQVCTSIYHQIRITIYIVYVACHSRQLYMSICIMNKKTHFAVGVGWKCTLLYEAIYHIHVHCAMVWGDGVVYIVHWFPCRDEFAYATSDGVVCVRQFALSPDSMCLLASLEGHHAEVTQVRRSIDWLLA